MIVDKLFVEGAQIHPQRATGFENIETQETRSDQRPNNDISAAPQRTPQPRYAPQQERKNANTR